MKKIFHLSTCSTCKRILGELNLSEDIELQDIKDQNISADELDFVKSKTGSYESIFSRRAMKYRGMGLHEKSLSENDYRKYMLEDYTFIKRPLAIIDDEVFVGNQKKIVAALKARLQHN